MVGGLGQPSTEPTHGWARVSLVRGQSGGATWAIDSQYAEARLSIGSAPDAGWCVQGIGVMPVHFELFWDGRSLWIADTRRVGGVAVNGRAIQDWMQLRGRVEVSFGSAGMLIETSDASVQEMASNPGHATRVTLAPELVGDKRGTGSMNIASLAQAPEGQSWDSMPEDALQSEATRIAPPPSERRASERPPLDPESTRIAPGLDSLPSLSGIAPRAAAPRSGAPPPPPGLMRPRLGGQPAAPAAPSELGRPMARTISANEMSQHVAEATRIAAGLDVGPPPPGLAASSVQVQAGYPGVSSGTGGFAPVGAPATAPAMPLPGSPGGPAGGFAAPPTFDQAHAAQQKPEGAKDGKGKQALPTRTWVLLAITVLAAVGLMMMGPREVEVAAPQAGPATGVPGPLPAQQAGAQPGAQAGQPATAGTTPATGTAPETGTAGTFAVPGLAPGTTAPGTTAPGTTAPGTTAPGTIDPAPIPVPIADPTATPTGPTEDRQAADLVIAGRWDEALPRYRALAVAHPERPEYSQMVRILERRLSGLCQGGVGPDGRPCSPGGAR